MAPISSTHRDSKPLKSILKKSSTDNFSKPDTDSLFPKSKRDKRHIKHAQLLSKISKSHSKPKRRRPNKKLVATLDSLVDALPSEATAAQSDQVAGDWPEQQVNVIKRESLKSRPGALKRKQKLDNEERERFTKNMAQMAAREIPNGRSDGLDATAPSDQTATNATGRWAALRGFIAQTLDKRADIGAVKI